jgi:YfiH family protein
METLIFPKIFDRKVKAFFTGRMPGCDIRRISEIASVDRQNIYLPIQKHTDKVLLLDSLEPMIGDSVVTDRKGFLIGVQGADCVPVLIYDRRAQVVGAVHAGWRGTAAGILKQTLKRMTVRFASSPSDIALAIGPAIRWCCYNVGYEVVDALRKATGSGEYLKVSGERFYVDLAAANRCQAVSAGVSPENVWMSDDCTFCTPDKYYSYRFAKGPTGRQGGFIGII